MTIVGRGGRVKVWQDEKVSRCNGGRNERAAGGERAAREGSAEREDGRVAG
jgi:hypothetical protein